MNFKLVVTYVIGLMILTATAVSAGEWTIMDVDRRSNTISVGEEQTVNENKTLVVTEEEPDNVTHKETHKVTDNVTHKETHKVTHRVTAEVRPVVNMPTHGFYRGYNDMGKAVPYAASAHLKYSFSLSAENKLGMLYPTAYQGIGIAAHTFFNKDLVGSPVIMYLFQGSRLADLGQKVSLDYEWNLGASYGWKVNEVVGSRWNIYINVGMPFTWHANPKCDISFGPEYTHFSNGDTTFPNGGANTVGVRLGVTWKSSQNGSAISSHDESNGWESMNYDMEEKAPGRLLVQGEPELKKQRPAKRISYDIFVYGAWRADRYIHEGKLQIINEPHAVAGMTFNPLYKLNRYFSMGPGLDIMLDRSADLNKEIATLPLTQQTACGVSAKAELTMPYFSINLGAGYNVLSKANDLKGFYTTYNLKAFVSQKLFITMGYRLGSVNYAHNLMFGVGIRL